MNCKCDGLQLMFTFFLNSKIKAGPMCWLLYPKIIKETFEGFLGFFLGGGPNYCNTFAEGRKEKKVKFRDGVNTGMLARESSQMILNTFWTD